MSTIVSPSSSERVPAPGPLASTALVPVAPPAPGGATLVAPAAPLPALAVDEVLAHVRLVREVMARTMVEGLDYGRIPGCGDKPVLLKPGAERLCLAFRLAPSFAIEERHLERGHREVRVVCTLSSMGSGILVGQGVGAASTLESRHGRQAPGESTGRPVPRAYWDVRQEDPAKAQKLIGGKGYATRKLEGVGWVICQGGGERAEHDNPADLYNTILKLGKKRALVDAVLGATACSSMFGQDHGEDRMGDGTVRTSISSASEASPAENRREQSKSIAVEIHDEEPTVGVEATAMPASSDPGVDWRSVRIPFGKNRGASLAELSDEQVGWYLERWLPRREAAGPLAGEDATLATGLRAYDRQRGSSAPR